MSKNMKKYFNATLATAVAASGVAVAAPVAVEASTTFTDVKATDYFYKDIVNLQERGIIKGFEDGSFRPNQSVTRGQAAKILAGVLGLNTDNVKNPGFTDIPATHQYYGAIAALANAGIISGFEDGTFRQGEPVLRNHIAKMIANGFGLETAADAKSFTDVRADYAPFITALVSNNVTTGKTATTFDGGSNVTRGQLAAFVVRAENAKKPEAAAQEVELTIAEVTANGVKAGNTTYTASAAVKAFFTAANAAVLKDAKVVALVENNEIVSVKNVTLTADGTLDAGNIAIAGDVVVKAANVTVKNAKVAGKVIVDELAVKPVASLTAIAADQTASKVVLENVTAATVEVNRDNVALSSKEKLTNVVVGAAVKTVEVNAPVAKLSVGAAETVAIKGTAVIDQLVVAAKAKVTIDAATKVTKLVVPAGVKAEDVVTNYNEVKANIATIEAAAETKPSYSGGGGGSSRDDDDDDSDYTVGTIDGEKITSAGTYGPASGTKVIEGNLIITAADVTLRNVTVKGNLVLAEGIGEGDVHLKGVKVEGETRVNGGGKNSVYFEDSVLATVIVNKNNGAVRIVAQGSTQVFEVQLETPTLVVEQNLAANSTGFEDIIVSEAMQTAGEGVQVELQGVFDTVNSRATNVRINLAVATDIRTLVLNVAAQVLGAGTIQTARINANGSTISQQPQNVVLDISGHVDVTIAGERVTESYSDPNTTAVVSAIHAAQGTIAVEMDNFIAGLTAEDFDVTATLNGEALELNGLYYDESKSQLKFKAVELQGNIGKTVEITVTPKHEKLSTAAVKSSFVVSTGFGGRITDIQGVGIPNLDIKFRVGSGTTAGEVVATAKTDAFGYYTVNVPAGVYTGEFSAPGYLTTYLVASAASDVFKTDANETAMRAAASEEIKIMLTWDEHPRDLDSHLVGPGVNGNEFHIAYYEKQYTNSGIVYADLDWDDTSSFGPETTTIRKLVDGEYRFYVHHFSGFNTLRTSGAKVHVYLGNATTPTQSFDVPAGEGSEIYWNVFDLVVTNNGETVTIRPVNTLEQERTPEMLTDLTIAKNTILNRYMQFDILETADQTVKTAAVQDFINNLELPAGVTGSVEYQDYGQYTVKLEKDGDILTFTVYPSFKYDPNVQPEPQPEPEPEQTTTDTVEFTFTSTVDVASIDVTEIYTTTADTTTVTTEDGVTVTTTDTGALAISFGSLTVSTADTVVIVVTDAQGNQTPYEVKFNGTTWVATVRAPENN